MPAVTTSISGCRVLGVRCDQDVVLHTVAPLGLAAAAPPCLVIDLDPAAPRYGSPSSLAQMVTDGPRRADLVPGRSGVAVLASGGAGLADSEPLVRELVARWPRVVVRAGDGVLPWPTVPVRLLVPELRFRPLPGPAVYQPVLPVSPSPRPGLVLPVLSRSLARSLLAGRVEPRRRWVRAWAAAWRLPWE